MDLKDLLKAVRKEKKLTPEQLAKLCQLPHHLIYLAEVGAIKLTKEQNMAIAQALEIDQHLSFDKYEYETGKKLKTLALNNVIFLQDMKLNKK